MDPARAAVLSMLQQTRFALVRSGHIRLPSKLAEGLHPCSGDEAAHALLAPRRQRAHRLQL